MNVQSGLACSPKTIADHPFFKGINRHYLHLLSEAASSLKFGIGEYLFRENNEANCFYVIQQGKIGVETFVPLKGATIIQTLATGDAVGWSWLTPPYRWQFSARALDPSTVIALDAPALRSKMEENHDFGYDLLRRISSVMSQRLHATRHRLVEFYSPEAFAI